MQHNFCTLLSRDYLYKGLALHSSLLEHDEFFNLFIFCMDAEIKGLLEKQKLKDAYIIDMSEVEHEDKELLETKAERSTQEYAWTAKASVMLYVLRHYENIDNIIWLDGDTAFFSDPMPIYKEWGEYSILLTEEKYTGKYEEKSRIYGKYQLGFMGFKRDKIGLACLEWFRSKVIEWCFNKFEDGRWADQMYACHWPEMFKSVRVVKHKGINVNPFILYRYSTEQGLLLKNKGDRIYIGDEEIVLFHFYGFDYYNGEEYDLNHYGSYLSDDALVQLYKPYVESVKEAADNVKKLAPEFFKDKAPRGKRIKNYFNLRADIEITDNTANFCTFTSKEYLNRCLALHQSLESCSDFRLWVCCLDEEAYDILEKLQLQNTILIDSRCIEDDELRNTRKSKCIKAYVYCAKACLLLFLLSNNYGIEKIVYVDADVYFYSNIDWLFSTLETCSILLLKKLPEKKEIGKTTLYNSCLIGFRRDSNTFSCIEKWKYSSLWHSQNDWQFDLKSYRNILNHWPLQFSGIKVLSSPSVLMEANSRYAFALIGREGKPYFRKLKLMAMHFASIGTDAGSDYGSNRESGQFLKRYEDIINLMNERVYSLESSSVSLLMENESEEIKYQGDFIRSKSVVVTGANGFIGSRLVKRLVEYGANVNVLARETSNLWRLEQELPQVKLHYVDMRDADKVSEAIEAAKPVYVFHMAAYGVDHRQKDYTEAASTNIIGTINLLNAIKASNCKKVINLGTSMQYGNKNGAIIEESRYMPSNIYGSTKAAATIVAHQIAGENNIDIITIIPFGVFGESEGSHKFFPHVILSVINGIQVELSHCEHFRDYCYVENIIDGFLLAAESDIKNEIFNIGSGCVHQLKYYVDLIVNKIGLEALIKYGAVEYRKNDLWNPQPDITKITGMLGWTPRVSLEEGLDKTIGWFGDNYEKYSFKGR